MEKQTKQGEMKGYDKTNRNFEATDKDIQSDKKDKQQLKPEKYPVNNMPNKVQGN